MINFTTLFKFAFKLTVPFWFIGVALAHSIENFEEAKIMARKIWSEHRETFYCACPYDKHGLINYKHCAYQPKDKRKAKRINWEHIVAASWYGKNLDCWNKPLCTSSKGKQFKGRNCCRKIDPQFKKMEADLHNLVPEIPEINQARSNYHFTEFNLEDNSALHYLRGCPIIIDERYRLVEPQDSLKGMIARVHLYMADQYGVTLRPYEKRLFSKWNKRYPAKDWEKRWNKKVATVQGNENRYVH